MSRYPMRFWLSLWLALLAILGTAAHLFAHGGTGTPEITNQEIGSYRLFVWSEPSSPQVGDYHVAVALTESLPDDPSGFAGEPILDAEVMVALTHLQSGERLTAQATHANAVNKVYYEAHFDVPTTGEWEVEIMVQGSDGPVTAAYSEAVKPASFRWMPLAAAVIAALLLIGAIAFYRLAPAQPAEGGV